MKKLTIVGDEKILKMIQKENQIRFRKFNMISCIEEVIEETRPFENLQKKDYSGSRIEEETHYNEQVKKAKSKK
jgi:hypothetical protein